MEKIQIKNKFTDEVIFEYKCENNTIKKTVEEAVKRGIKLGHADLKGANLRNAKLNHADLSSTRVKNTDFREAILVDTILKDITLKNIIHTTGGLINSIL